MIRRAKKGNSPKVDKRNGVKRAKSNVPDQIDINLKYEEFLKFMKSLDEDGSPKPITEKQLMALIRSAVRKKWMSCKTKLAFLEKTRIPDTNPNTRTMWLWECEMCKGKFKSDEINVDHKKGESSFTSIDQALPWASNILDVSFDDLQILCIPDHMVKNVMDANDCSYEDAVNIKKAIEILDDKDNLLTWFKERNILYPSNAKLRREAIIKYLEESNK